MTDIYLIIAVADVNNDETSIAIVDAVKSKQQAKQYKLDYAMQKAGEMLNDTGTMNIKNSQEFKYVYSHLHIKRIKNCFPNDNLILSDNIDTWD